MIRVTVRAFSFLYRMHASQAARMSDTQHALFKILPRLLCHLVGTQNSRPRPFIETPFIVVVTTHSW
jgi:hypothetical protein